MITQESLTDHLVRFRLTNSSGIEATILNLGATLMSLHMPDREGNIENVVLGLPNPEDYLNDHPFLGSTIGRFGNRIRNGQFQLHGKTYQLDTNLGAHHLHGGKKGFHTRLWTGRIKGEKLILTYPSPATEGGYPGNLDTSVSFELTERSELVISFSAVSDADTHVNMTHHAYFNLCGNLKRDVCDHILQLNAHQITAVDNDLVPTGELVSIIETPLDFTTPKRVGEDIAADHPLITLAGGYDHNYVLDREKEGLMLAARLEEPESGRALSTYTTQPGLQVFTANGMAEAFRDSSNKPMLTYGAICLEPQHFPDSPNIPHFPSTLLAAGEIYEETIVYHFES
ncbi:MAG: aldose epimerase family protein [Bacteroidota bacterium]